MTSQGQQQQRQQQRVSESSDQLSCRANLRGAEDSIFDLVCAGTNRRQWAEWLRTPLEHAAGAGNLDLVTKLQGAGAGGSALHVALRAGQDALARELLRLGAPSKEKDNNGDTPLHLAAASGLGDVVSLLLRNGAGVDVLDSEGRTPIHLSAERGSLSAVQALLAAGGDSSLRYGKDKAFSALGLAASGGHVEVMQALIRHGVDVNAPDSNGCTALHSAAMGDKVGAIDVLVEAGANINVQGGKYELRYTPLHMASDKGSSEAALSLVKHGADLHRFGCARTSALCLAARSGHISIVKTLLAAGARVNLRPAYSYTPALSFACERGHADVVTSLIQYGAKVDATDSDGCTALFSASQENNVAVIDKLVAAGASVNGIVDHYGRTPLHHVCLADCPEAIVSMLRHGARVDVQDDFGETPLHVASVEGCPEGIRVLVQHGADINKVTADGRTPLSFAAENHWYGATKVLLDAGADVNAPASITNGSQALSLAASSGCMDTMRVLIQHGANVNATDTAGGSALHRAASGNQVDAIDALILAGATIEATDNYKSTPLAVAFRSAMFRCQEENNNYGSEEFAAMTALLKHGADPNIRNIEEGCPDTLLHYCIAHGCPVSVFRELLAAGPNLEVRGRERRTLLHAAGNHPDWLQALLGSGADMEAQDSNGQTALHKAAESGNVLCINALVIAGAIADVKDVSGCTPLHMAAWSHQWDATLALLQTGADVASINNYGCSSLHLAVTGRHFDLNSSEVPRTVDLLLRWGADENAVDSNGDTPAIRWGKNAELFGVSSANTKSVPQLLERAQRDKAWRRRGWLVLCRAFPNRVQLKSERGRTCGAVVRRVRARNVGAEAGSGSGNAPSPGKAMVHTAGALTLEGRAALGGLSALVATVVGLHVEGVFRAIMEFV